MKSTSEKGVYVQETKNGYTVSVNFNLYRVYVTHPTHNSIKYDLDKDSPMSHVSQIIKGIEKLQS